MCGRYNVISNPAEMVEDFTIHEAPDFDLRPNYNAAPQQTLPIVRLEGAHRALRLVRWGLVPAWSKEPKSQYATINARAEEAAGRPAFRAAWKARRCLVPANGWYEWQKGAGGAKTPHLLRAPGGALLAFAGLWERWERDGAPALETFAIVTVPASAFVAHVHDRMPALLAREHFAAWLDAATPADQVRALVARVATGLEAFPVSPLVGSVKNNRAELLVPAGSLVEVA